MPGKMLFTKERKIVMFGVCIFTCLLCLYVPLVVESFPFQLMSMFVLAILAGPLLAGFFDGSAEYGKQTVVSIALAAVIGTTLAMFLTTEFIHAYLAVLGIGLGALFFYPMNEVDDNTSLFTCFYLMTTAMTLLCATLAATLSTIFTNDPLHSGWTIFFGVIITIFIGWVSQQTGHDGNFEKIGSAVLGALIPVFIVPAALGCGILLSAMFAVLNMLIIFAFFLAYKPKKATA